ncbi:MAG TPA: glycoside hydrolase family 125 protein, partial [Terriglobales bacterium]
QFVGVTSRSPRYYVSAAYWDRDAMLWSFPGLLDVDKNLAREALEYAFTIQLRNTGIHSRFIDGVVLEDGFQLDEAVAPVIATANYIRRTCDDAFLLAHANELKMLRDRILSRFDPQVGLYSTLQDSQDEYQKQAFLTYDNVLAWKALNDLGEMFERLKDAASAREMKGRAASLRTAILSKSVSDKAPGATAPMFVGGTDGTNPLFTDVPPGSLMRLPDLGFISQDDPVFVHTYQWFHSPNYKYSYSNEPYGLPGSYRLPITTSWSVADHMNLKQGRDQALKVLRTSSWDGGIITEGVNPKTAAMDYAGRAFATAAGYVAHAICENFCTDSAAKK